MSFGHLAHAKPSLEVPIVTGPHADVATFTSNAAIAAGQVVMLDITLTTVSDREKYVIASTAALGAAAIGVALEAATGAEEVIRVCIAGYCEGVSCAAGVAAGDSLYADDTGQVDDTAAAATLPVFGVALSALDAVANTCTAYIYRNY
tara:strand:+ start:7506 stop:7949 length:444 start_codon:yes stop_codon:yes gene_type:complete